MNLEEQFKSETGKEAWPDGTTARLDYVWWLEKRAAVEERLRAIDWGYDFPTWDNNKSLWLAWGGQEYLNLIEAPTLSELCDKAEALLKEGEADDK